MKTARAFVAAASAAALSASAGAQTQDVVVGDYRISQQLPGVCQVVSRVSERLVLNAFVVKADGRIALTFNSDIWRLNEGQQLPGQLSWDNWQTAQEVTFSVSALHESLRSTPDDVMLATDLVSPPDDQPAFPRPLWVRIPAVHFAGNFSIGDGAETASAIAACRAQ